MPTADKIAYLQNFYTGKGNADAKGNKPGEGARNVIRETLPVDRIRELSMNPLSRLNYPAKQQSRDALARSDNAREMARSNYLEGARAFTGHLYPFITARMFGQRQIHLIPKFAYVYEEPDTDEEGNEVTHLVSRFRTRRPHKPKYGDRGTEKDKYLPPTKTDGKNLPGERVEFFSDRPYYVKSDEELYLDDMPEHVMRPEPGKPLIYDGRRINLPPGAVGIVATVDENGNVEPYVRDWFPFTMSGWGKDMAYEDAQFVHHTDHVYGELTRLISEAEEKGKNYTYNSLRAKAERIVRSKEAKGEYNLERGYDWSLILDDLYNKEVQRLVEEAVGPMTGDLEQDKARQAKMEALMNDRTIKIKARKRVNKLNKEIQSKARQDVQAYEEAREILDENYAYFEAQYLDRFWDELAQAHPGMEIVDTNPDGIGPSDPKYDPRKIHVLWPASDAEITAFELDIGHLTYNSSGSPFVRLDYQDIMNVCREQSWTAQKEFGEIYGRAGPAALERINEALGLEREYCESEAIRKVESQGISWDRLDPIDQQNLIQEQSLALQMGPQPERMNKLVKFKKAQEDAEQAERDAEMQRQQEQATADENIASFMDYSEKYVQNQQLREQMVAENLARMQAKAAREIKRLAERPTLKDIAKAASYHMHVKTAPLRAQLEHYQKTMTLLRKLQSNMDKVFDSFSVSKVVNRLRQNMVNVRKGEGEEYYSLLTDNTKTRDVATELVDDLIKFYGLEGENALPIQEQIQRFGMQELPDPSDKSGVNTTTVPELTLRQLTAAIKQDVAAHGRPTYPDRTGSLYELAEWMTRNSEVNHAYQSNSSRGDESFDVVDKEGRKRFNDKTYTGNEVRNFHDTPISDLDLQEGGVYSNNPRLLGEFVSKLLHEMRTTADKLDTYESSEEAQSYKADIMEYHRKAEESAKESRDRALEKKGKLPSANDSWVSQMRAENEFDEFMSQFPGEIDYFTLKGIIDDIAKEKAIEQEARLYEQRKDRLAELRAKSEDPEKFDADLEQDRKNYIERSKKKFTYVLRTALGSESPEAMKNAVMQDILNGKEGTPEEQAEAESIADTFIKDTAGKIRNKFADILKERFPEMAENGFNVPPINSFMSRFPEIYRVLQSRAKESRADDHEQGSESPFESYSYLNEVPSQRQLQASVLKMKLPFINKDVMEQFEGVANAARNANIESKRAKMKGKNPTSWKQEAVRADYGPIEDAIKSKFFELFPDADSELWEDFYRNYDMLRDMYVEGPRTAQDDSSDKGEVVEGMKVSTGSAKISDAVKQKSKEDFEKEETARQAQFEKYVQKMEKLKTSKRQLNKALQSAAKMKDREKAVKIRRQMTGLNTAMKQVQEMIMASRPQKLYEKMEFDGKKMAPIKVTENPDGPQVVSNGKMELPDVPENEISWDYVKEEMEPKIPKGYDGAGGFTFSNDMSPDDSKALRNYMSEYIFYHFPDDNYVFEQEDTEDGTRYKVRVAKEGETPASVIKPGEMTQEEFDQRRAQSQRDQYLRDVERAKKEIKAEEETGSSEPPKTEDFSDAGDAQSKKDLKAAKDAHNAGRKDATDTGGTSNKQDPVSPDKKEASVPNFENIFKSAQQERYNRYQGVMSNMDEDDPMSFRNMLKKANEDQAKKRGAYGFQQKGPNVMCGTKPNFMPDDREPTTPIEPEVRSDSVQGASRKTIKI